MNLTIAQYKALYEEMLEVNEENIQGMFFVSTEEELKVLAMQFLINKWKRKIITKKMRTTMKMPKMLY
ncbi:hypothetical protein [Lysinibacillus sp. FSL P4-0201]|uniref:hypothetical protein n=1 Tax=Lysinibacillus sp. FSL P4-0201 TaxID=2921721 RepID=UPI00315ADFF5